VDSNSLVYHKPKSAVNNLKGYIGLKLIGGTE